MDRCARRTLRTGNAFSPRLRCLDAGKREWLDPKYHKRGCKPVKCFAELPTSVRHGCCGLTVDFGWAIMEHIVMILSGQGRSMSDKFQFDEEFFPVPPSAIDADPLSRMEDLLYRVGRLEQTLDEERVQALGDMREVMLELISLSDDVTDIVERWGVTSNAREAAIVRSVVALGRKVLAILKHHQVVAVETIGQPLNPQTSDAVGAEVRDKVPEGTVLREAQIGYMWSQGLLRRAQVVVSARPRTPEEAAASEAASLADGADVTIDQLMADAAGEQEQTLRDGGPDQESES